MPEADAEDRRPAHEPADAFMHIGQRRWIAGTVGKKHAVRFQCEHVGGGCRRGHDLHFETLLPQAAQDVALHAEIVGDDVVLHRRQLLENLAVFRDLNIRAVAFHDRPRAAQRVVRVPFVGGTRRHFFHKIRAGHGRRRLGPRHGLLRRDVLRREAALHRAARAQMLRQRPRVDALDAGDAPLFQILVERPARPPVARHRAQLLNDISAHMHRRALVVERVHAVVADLRRGHGHDLPAVRRIGQHLLVAAHRGIEANLADRRAGGAKGFA